MHRMTPFLLAALLAVPAMAAAQENQSTQTRTIFENESDRNGWTTASYALHAEPREQRVRAGEAATFTLVAKSSTDQTISLAASGPDAGYRYGLSSTQLHLFAGQSARTTLTVKPHAETEGRAVFLVHATNAEGERSTQEVVLHTHSASPPPPPRPWMTFALRAEALGAEEGGDGRAYRIVVRSAIDQEIRLGARTSLAGADVRIEPDVVHVAAGGMATAILRVERASEPAWLRIPTMVGVAGESASGERHEIRVLAGIGEIRLEPVRLAPAATVHVELTPSPERRPERAPMQERPILERSAEADLAVKVAELSARVERLEAALRLLGIRLDASGNATVRSP